MKWQIQDLLNDKKPIEIILLWEDSSFWRNNIKRILCNFGIKLKNIHK